ncbi:hypothetical protein [Pseudomonas sp. HY2-MNA-CIBAN-0224]
MLTTVIVEDHRIQSPAGFARIAMFNGKGSSEEQGDEFMPSTLQ